LFWLSLILAAVTVSVFSPLYRSGFIEFDDQMYVTENPYVRSGLNPTSVAWAFQTSTAGNWHPLAWLSHMLDCQLFGMKPGWHHLTSVLIHTANAVLLLLLLHRLTGATWRSAFVAALFAWHPAHLESVAWISERKDVLCAFFFLAALLAYAGWGRNGGGRYFYLTLFLFALSLLAKPMAVTFPLVLLLLDAWPLGRLGKTSFSRLAAEKIPFALLSLACCLWTWWAQQRNHAIATAGELHPWHRAAHALSSCLSYVLMLAWPHDLAVYYPYPHHENAAMVCGGALLLIVLTALALAVWRTRPWWGVGWLWFVVMLVPVIGIVQAGNQSMADRYTYLPAIGLFIVFAWGGYELTVRLPRARWLAFVLVATLLPATFQQAQYWKNTQTLFEQAHRVTRENYVATTLLGNIRAEAGDMDGAMAFYQEALRDRPNYSEAHFYYARGLEKQGKEDLARDEYETALRIDPNSEKAHLHLGLLLAREKNDAAAAAEYEAVLQNNPDSAAAHNDLARLRQSEGKLDDSVAHYLAAIHDDPNLAQAHNNLGVLYLQRGQLVEAAGQLREALRLDPNDFETRYNLAMALLQQEQWAGAVEILTNIAPQRVNDAGLQYACGLALERTGDTRQAMSQYAWTLLLTPNDARALNALAWIAATDGRTEFRNGAQAVEMAGRACELTARKDPEMLLTLAAAEAEAVQFKEAVTVAREAGELAGTAGNKAVVEKSKQLLSAFEAGQPFRQTAPVSDQSPPGKPDPK
jgi:tetratricopeptide (TPR) repeat protein